MKDVILSTVQTVPDAAPEALLLSAYELSSRGVPAFMRDHLFRYRSVRLIVPRLAMGLPMKAMLAARLMTLGHVMVVDAEGVTTPLGPVAAMLGLVKGAAARFSVPGLMKRSARGVAALEAAVSSGSDGKNGPIAGRADGLLYLRCDLWFGIQAGGAVAHTSGVLNALFRRGERVAFWSPAVMPMVDDRIATNLVEPQPAWWPRPHHHELAFNEVVQARLSDVFEAEQFRFLYHRYCVNCYAAALLAVRTGTPLILEYNGSEAWIRANWGGEDVPPITLSIEDAVLRAAFLIVVVSEALRDELVARGIPTERILVNPNGVDTERFGPQVDGSRLRGRLGLTDKIVFGFIGTFGRWHGAEILAEAFVTLLRQAPALKSKVHLLLVGDGAMMPRVREILVAGDALQQATLTGLVPQQKGPEYLAAADILVSPHVPNADGSAFFGSPTKLFEYMAMEKPIIASDLDQIGQVLQHDRTAILVPPGNADALSEAMRKAVASPKDLRPLAVAARKDAVARFSWDRHVGRILERAEALMQEGAAFTPTVNPAKTSGGR